MSLRLRSMTLESLAPKARAISGTFANSTRWRCPYLTLNTLLPQGVLSERMERRAAHIPTDVTEGGHLKIDVACSGKLDVSRFNSWRKDGLDLREPIVSWQSYEDHVDAWDDTVGRRWPKTVPFIGIVPTALDPTQAPAGQDTFWLWSGIIPNKPEGGWDRIRDEVGNTILAECAKVYKGLDSLEIGRSVISSPDLAERFNVPGGNVYHVDPVAMRFGPLRPALGLGGYRTPVPGLYLTGAGTHPTGGISGIPGFVAAKTLLKDLKKSGLPHRPAAAPAATAPPPSVPAAA